MFIKQIVSLFPFVFSLTIWPFQCRPTAELCSFVQAGHVWSRVCVPWWTSGFPSSHANTGTWSLFEIQQIVDAAFPGMACFEYLHRLGENYFPKMFSVLWFRTDNYLLFIFSHLIFAVVDNTTSSLIRNFHTGGGHWAHWSSVMVQVVDMTRLGFEAPAFQSQSGH